MVVAVGCLGDAATMILAGTLDPHQASFGTGAAGMCWQLQGPTVRHLNFPESPNRL